MNGNIASIPERKYQIFISSTFRDLVSERDLVLDIIVERGHIPVALERFPAADAPVAKVIEVAISNSQIYVVLVGHRYGEIADMDTGRSYCEYEFDIAKAKNIIILPFVLDKTEAKEKRKEMKNELQKLEGEVKDIMPDSFTGRSIHKRIDDLATKIANEERYWSFRETVTKERFQRPFKTSDFSFSGIVSRSLEKAEDDARDRKLLGWVKEPERTDLAEVLPTLSGNELLVNIIKQLGGFETLSPRFEDHPKQKIAAASFFATTYLHYLCNNKVNLFFESGSSVAYVAREIGRALRVDVSSGIPNVHISTNNVLAYLYLWLAYRIPVSLFPWGPPEMHYGAIFGCLDYRYPDRGFKSRPKYPPDPLDYYAQQTISMLLDDHFSPSKWKKLKSDDGNRNGLLLCALSGLQLSKKCTTLPPNVNIKECFGPHVGTFKNKIFKRFLYDTKLPLAIFLHAEKINCPVNVDKCNFILDEKLPWTKFRNEYPVAFCVGCDAPNTENYVELFVNEGFRVLRARNPTKEDAFIARNQKFIDEFETAIGFVQ